MERRDILISYHTRGIAVGIAERGFNNPGPVKRPSHYDCFWVTIRDTIGSWKSRQNQGGELGRRGVCAPKLIDRPPRLLTPVASQLPRTPVR